MSKFDVMEQQQAKASLFIQRLAANPALSAMNGLQKEEQILQFLNINRRQLMPTLTSPQFFPRMNAGQIWGLLTATLLNETTQRIVKDAEALIWGKINMTFLDFLAETAEAEKVRSALRDAVLTILKNPLARREFCGVYTALINKLPDKYIGQSMDRKKYVHFELIKVQRLKLGREELGQFIKASLLLRALVHTYVSTGEGNGGGTNPYYPSNFVHSVSEKIMGRYGALPRELVRSACESSASFAENSKIGASARITAVMSNLGKSYKPQARMDRGADTLEKSWYNTARRNYKFYGFDLKMLDEFYNIAAENGW